VFFCKVLSLTEINGNPDDFVLVSFGFWFDVRFFRAFEFGLCVWTQTQTQTQRPKKTSTKPKPKKNKFQTPKKNIFGFGFGACFWGVWVCGLFFFGLWVCVLT